jgi:hypothetical protein
MVDILSMDLRSQQVCIETYHVNVTLAPEAIYQESPPLWHQLHLPLPKYRNSQLLWVYGERPKSDLDLFQSL